MSELLYVNHLVEPGEDLFKLAELYYADASLWWIIYHANLDTIGDDPETLSVGMNVQVPYLEIAKDDALMPEIIPATSFSNSEDPLFQFAQDRYGDPLMAFDIREENSLADDAVVPVGTKLRLPPRGKPQNLSLALSWRKKFYRSLA